MAKYIVDHGRKEAALLLLFKKMALENNTVGFEA